jgi:hypothetical protein
LEKVKVKVMVSMKGLDRRNTHVKYESPRTYQSNIMTKVKVLEKVKPQGWRTEGQGHGIKWKVLPEGIHMWNMKALPPTNQTLWPMLILEKKAKVKGKRIKVMVSNERSCWKEYTCEIWKPKHLPIKSYDEG